MEGVFLSVALDTFLLHFATYSFHYRYSFTCLSGPVVLSQGGLLSPRGRLAMFGNGFGWHSLGGECSWHQWVEAIDITKILQCPGQHSATRNCPSANVCSAEVEKPCSSPWNLRTASLLARYIGCDKYWPRTESSFLIILCRCNQWFEGLEIMCLYFFLSWLVTEGEIQKRSNNPFIPMITWKKPT